jgi:hypothetical protein
MKKNTFFLIIFGLSLCQGFPAFADIYRCDQDGKKTVYQQTPCDFGNQTAIDSKASRKVREEEERKKLDQQRAKEKSDQR